MNEPVQFDNSWQSTQVYQEKIPWMFALVIKNSGGLVRNKDQAAYVLLALAIIFIIITLLIIFLGGSEVLPPPKPSRS